MHRFADVVGHPIDHSMSPVILSAAHVQLECRRVDLCPGELAQFVQSCGHDYAGLAVTMPFKHEAFQVCNMVDGLATNVGSINTLVFQPTGSSRMVLGFNTDVAGIVHAIREVNGSDRVYSKAVILGSGATAASALAAVTQLKAKTTVVCARTLAGPHNAVTAAHRMNIDATPIPLRYIASALDGADLVISTLPAHVADTFISDLDHLDFSSATILDVVYDPSPTQMASRVLADGGTNVPGWLMLLHQGIAQAQLFTARQPDSQAMRTSLVQAIEEKYA